MSYPEFRRRLDEVLRQRDPAALRSFLIAEGQWTDATTTDPESAMWMMIATSPALAELREEARRWLLTHGHEVEAQAIFGAKRPSMAKSPARTGGKAAGRPPAHKGRPKRQGETKHAGSAKSAGHTHDASDGSAPNPRGGNKRPHR